MPKKIIQLIIFSTATFILSACGVDGSVNSLESFQQQSEKTYNGKVIYGEDNRKDLFEVKNKKLLQLADSTAGMVLNRRISLNSNGTYRLKASTYGTSHQLCKEERFYQQRIAISCSAFLVAPNTIITAGHCVRNQTKCDDVSFVFSLSLKDKNKGDNFSSVKKSEVYACKKLVRTVENENGNLGADYAVITLDRDVTNHTPLKLRRTGEINKGDLLAVIGHPKGLPTKVADEAKVTSVEKEYFVSDLDTYSGNSGSAVFNLTSGEVEGILVRGAHDFAYDKKRKCFTSNVCKAVDPEVSCRGEDVSKIKYALPFLPAIKNKNLFTSNKSLSIPDNEPKGITSSIVVPPMTLGKKFLLHLNITHSWRGDLSIDLISPQNDKINLLENQGGASDNIIETFGETEAFKTHFKNLVKQSPKGGTWTLHIKDEYSRDTGMLNHWSIEYK